jgi:tetratricopeptide (TPR) repeat protein
MTFFTSLVRALLMSLALCTSGFAQTAVDPFDKAQKLFDEGKTAEAWVTVNAQLESQPRDLRYRFLKGVLLGQKGQLNEAIALYTELTREFPELAEPYNNLAVIYSGQGKLEEAKAALEMALRNSPSYAVAHENLGNVYLQLAKLAFARALALSPNNASLKAKALKTDAALQPVP